MAGIAGKKNFSMVCIEKSLMNKEVGFAHRLLGVFQRRGISVEHCPSSIDGINVVVEQSALGAQAEEVLEEIRRNLLPDRISFSPSARRRGTLRISAIVMSAVSSVKTPGVFDTMMPFARAAARSI